MKNPNLTSAQVKEISSSQTTNIELSLTHIDNIENYEYILIIRSETSRYSKITIYPIKKQKIIKLTLWGLKKIDEFTEAFSKRLQEYGIIHSTGLVMIEGLLFFECYLNLSLNEEKYKDLIFFLDKNKKNIKDIQIMEIS
ncbi:MAG TPA: hypothetical protein VMV43_09180 [Candidatus Nanopelagicaceae bacterium]|nr:hypothetical protein [Candidatus Nanopelagicaceae bacterium]